MEGQAFLTTIAGLAVSLAGFASLIAWLRDDMTSWDPVNLWRVKTIVRNALIIAGSALALIPAYTLTDSHAATVRIGSGLIVLFELGEMLRARHPDPAIWNPRYTWTMFMLFGALHAALHLVNLWLASLGLLQIGFLILLGSPAGIFSNFVRELGSSRSQPGETDSIVRRLPPS